MNVTTFAARSAAALVAAVAGAASYSHIADVAIAAGERAWVGYALPLAVDGLILVGVSALFEDKRAGRSGRLSARVAVGVGVLATLAANVASAEPHLQARLVAVTAPIAFLIAIEVLTRRGRSRETPDGPLDVGPVALGMAANAALAAALETDTDDDTDEAPEVASPGGGSTEDVAELSEGSADRVPSGVALSAAAARRAARALKAGDPDISTDTIAALIGRTPRTVERYLNGSRPQESAPV